MTYSGFDYPCSAGETFDSVALSIYGDEKYAAALLCMNPDLATTPVFIGGELLKLPVVEVPETFVDEPVSLKFLAKFGAVNLFPQFPQNSATSLFT